MKTIDEKKTEIQSEEASKQRAGSTKISSVSISKEMRDTIDYYKLSPTDIFRRGLGVALSEIGLPEYSTPLNKERIETFRTHEEVENIKRLIDELVNSIGKLKELKEILEKGSQQTVAS